MMQRHKVPLRISQQTPEPRDGGILLQRRSSTSCRRWIIQGDGGSVRRLASTTQRHLMPLMGRLDLRPRQERVRASTMQRHEPPLMGLELFRGPYREVLSFNDAAA